MGEPAIKSSLVVSSSRKKQERHKATKDKENVETPDVRFHVYEDSSSSRDKNKNKKSVKEMSVQTDDVLCTCVNVSPVISRTSPESDHCDDHGDLSKEEEEVMRLLTQEEAPDSYWQEIVDRRKDALNDSLKENEMLRSAIEKLKIEISEVSELAEQENYFKDMIRTLTDEPNFGSDDEDLELLEYRSVTEISSEVTEKSETVDKTPDLTTEKPETIDKTPDLTTGKPETIYKTPYLTTEKPEINQSPGLTTDDDDEKGDDDENCRDTKCGEETSEDSHECNVDRTEIKTETAPKTEKH